jgi:hypothetical protein
MIGFEEIRGGEMHCLGCQQTRDTRFIPMNLVIREETKVEAHTLRVCSVCNSTELKPVHFDSSRKVDSSFRW